MRAVSGSSHLLSKPTPALSGAPTSHRRAPISLSAIALVSSFHGLITPGSPRTLLGGTGPAMT